MSVFIKPYGVKKKVRLICKGVGKTKQSEKDSCDLNLIVKKAQKGLVGDFMKENQGSYGDMSNAVSFHEAQNIVKTAEEKFGELPSSMRKRFDNSPENFLAFFDDKENAQEAFDLGLTTWNPSLDIVGEVDKQEKIDEGFTPD